MYAIVKTGGKQYKVAPGDKLNVEKLPGEAGDKITLDAICIVDGKNVEPIPAKASGTKVEAVVLEQFRGDKVVVFKFKKRKNYKRTRGHRQDLTRIQITAVGSEKMAEEKPKAKKAATTKAKKADTADKADAAPAKKAASKTAAKKKDGETKATTAKKTTAKKAEKADDAAKKASEE